jgi:hypothetical protein
VECGRSALQYAIHFSIRARVSELVSDALRRLIPFSPVAPHVDAAQNLTLVA